MPIKLGPQIYGVTDAGLLWARRANCTKQIFGTNALPHAQSGAITICRPIWRLRTDSGAEAARDIIRALDRWGGYRPSYVELWNESDEVGQRLGSGLERRVQLHEEAVPILHANGIRVAGFSFSTGNPGAGWPGDTPDWEYLQSHGYAGVDAIALHAYWGNQRFTEGHALRHRRAHAITGGNHPPFLITECGRDAVEGGSPGWRLSGISGEQYVSELLAYDTELGHDPYVIGATVFTTGGFEHGWGNFDVDELVPAIIGTGPPPTRYSCSNGVCYANANGPYASLAECQAACQPGPQPTGGISLSLLFGLSLGAVGAGILLAEYLGVQPEIVMRVSDVRELEEGQPIPPGYVIIG